MSEYIHVVNPMATAGDMLYGAGTDVLRGRTLTAGANGPTTAPTDGDDTTYWGSGNSSGSRWLVADLGSPVRIASTRVVDAGIGATAGEQRATWQIDGSTDGISWTNVFTTTTSPTPDSGNQPFAAATWRFWRLYTSLHNGGGDNGWTIGTWSLFPPGAGTPLRLPVGLPGQVLGVASGLPAWVTAAMVGSGAPSGAPPSGAAPFYFRTDTPGTALQRIYAYSGGSWSGIL